MVTRRTFRAAVIAQLGAGAKSLPPGLGNDFALPPLGGADAAGPAPAGAIPAPGAPVAEWRELFTKLKLSSTEVAAIGPDVCGPDAAANVAMLSQARRGAHVLCARDVRYTRR